MDTKKTRVYTCNVLDGTVAGDLQNVGEQVDGNQECQLSVTGDSSMNMQHGLFK